MSVRKANLEELRQTIEFWRNGLMDQINRDDLDAALNAAERIGGIVFEAKDLKLGIGFYRALTSATCKAINLACTLDDDPETRRGRFRKALMKFEEEFDSLLRLLK